MISVERVSEFGNLSSEAASNTDFDATITEWPKEPSIVLTGLTVRYQTNLPPALRRISMKIEAGERIGVVGR
jgi:ABC-type bacteriocin/lantibiotic exporter with double-glycine peptidase domain